MLWEPAAEDEEVLVSEVLEGLLVVLKDPAVLYSEEIPCPLEVLLGEALAVLECSSEEVFESVPVLC